MQSSNSNGNKVLCKKTRKDDYTSNCNTRTSTMVGLYALRKQALNSVVQRNSRHYITLHHCGFVEICWVLFFQNLEICRNQMACISTCEGTNLSVHSLHPPHLAHVLVSARALSHVLGHLCYIPAYVLQPNYMHHDHGHYWLIL